MPMQSRRECQCHVEQQSHRRIHMIAAVNMKHLFESYLFFSAMVTYLYILSYSSPVVHCHVTRVQKWIILRYLINNSITFALDVWQHQRGHRCRWAKAFLCVFFVMHIGILADSFHQCIRYRSQN